MRKLIKHFISAAALLLTASTAWGFVLGGPIGNAGDNWQVPIIGYGLPGDILAPKNIGEEYRRVSPIVYYAYDANFFGFFGLAGTTNVDLAFATMNSLTNVSSYSADLSEFPLTSQQYNYTAQSLLLRDLKSVTLYLLAEQMGLGEPERYAWTLHDRYQPSGTTCPTATTYLVVQRNFDTVNSPLNQVQYTPYVNGTLYTYQIFENCTGPNPLAGTIPLNTDPYASTYTPVASFNLDLGGYYTTFTRDDMAGLRYLLSSNNVNYEATAPSGGLLLQSNLLAAQLLTTLPISLLFSQSLTNDPAILTNTYPGLTYISVQTNIVNQIGTNRFAYFTNLAGPYTNTGPNFTNWSPVQYGNVFPLTTQPLAPLLSLASITDPTTLQLLYPGLLIGTINTNYLQVIYATNVIPYFTNQSVLPVFTNYTGGSLTNGGYYFTNQPGPTVINYDDTDFGQIITLSLADFVDRARTNDAATLQLLYPGIQILKSVKNAYQGYVTNYISYITNAIGSPYPGTPTAVTVAISTNPVVLTNWVHTFGNVVTNNFYTNRWVWQQDVWVTNKIGAPYPNIFTNISFKKYYTNQTSGDFFIIPTNWCGFQIILKLDSGNPPYTYGVTNVNNFNSLTNTTNVYSFTRNSYNVFTNYTYVVRPGICQPVLVYGTNYTTVVTNTYDYGFANIITNHYYTNTLVTVLTTNVYSCPGGSPNVLCSNITVSTFYSNTPSGDFYIVPTNWCGFQSIGLLTNLISATNTFVATNAAGGNTNGQYFTITTISYYTNYILSVRPGFCEPALTITTNFSTNAVTQYQYYFGNIITNRYYTNSMGTVVTTNLAVLTNGLVGMLTNIVTTNTVNLGVGGDFFIAPPAWCAYSILATQFTTVTLTTNQFAATNLATPDLGERYTETTVSAYTNSTFLIQPTICSTAPATPALRQGIERIQFIRANYDSLLGQFFAPLTNTYTMIRVTNSQPVKEFYQRIVTRPDFLMTAQDLNGGLGGLPVNPVVARNINFDQSTVLAGLAGPGTITNGTAFIFNKAGRTFVNVSPAFMAETNAATLYLWASFDGSTNDPVVYPNGTSIANLENQLFLQVTPATLLDGTVGTAYSPVNFAATGGQPPYTWAAPNISALVPGMSVSGTPTSATLSGTPTSAGTFNFTLQVTDSVNRVVNLNYTITIH